MGNCSQEKNQQHAPISNCLEQVIPMFAKSSRRILCFLFCFSFVQDYANAGRGEKNARQQRNQKYYDKPQHAK